MSRLLVCPPDYFRIDYEINPWMRRSNVVEPEQAVRQWLGLMEVLENDVGAVLERMTPVPGLPDLVFTANAGVVVGRKAVPSRFRYPERQQEEAHFEGWFRDHGYEIVSLDHEMYFEGAGDLLGFPDAWFGGYRQRSDIRAFPILSEVFGKEILPLELIDGRFYHLDTCFCPLSGGDLLYYPPAFDQYGQVTIAERISVRASPSGSRTGSFQIRMQLGVRREACRAAGRLSCYRGLAGVAWLSAASGPLGRIYEIRRFGQVPDVGT